MDIFRVLAIIKSVHVVYYFFLLTDSNIWICIKMKLFCTVWSELRNKQIGVTIITRKGKNPYTFYIRIEIHGFVEYKRQNYLFKISFLSVFVEFKILIRLGTCLIWLSWMYITIDLFKGLKKAILSFSITNISVNSKPKSERLEM